MGERSVVLQIREEARVALARLPLGHLQLERIASAPSLLDAVYAPVDAALANAEVPASEWASLRSRLALDGAAVEDDLAHYLERDFTAHSTLDVLLFSNGFHARASHRLAHALYRSQEIFAARTLQARATQVFGADIHPGAVLGRRLFLDHALGVVIGETAVVGDDCAIFQHVTLGSTTKAAGPRHPIVGARVSIGAGAVLVGRITIGDDVRVAPGALVIRDVPAGTQVGR